LGGKLPCFKFEYIYFDVLMSNFGMKHYANN
jgi:hypothetical protein